MGSILRAALATVDLVSRWAIVACMAAMIAVVSVQVFLRYGVSGSLDWAEEISRLSFVWATFLAIPHGVKLSAHVGIDLLTKRLPAAAANVLQALVHLASAVLMGIVAWQAALAARANWDQLMPTVDLSSGWFYLAVTVSCAHSTWHLLDQLLGRARGEGQIAGLEAGAGEAQ